MEDLGMMPQTIHLHLLLATFLRPCSFGWLRDPDCWPQRRTFEMFQEWFEIQMSFVGEDLYLDEPLESIE